MQIVLSSRKHIPLLKALGREYYPWQLRAAIRFWFTVRRIEKIAAKHQFVFSKRLLFWWAPEWTTWEKYYTPNSKLTPNSLILDAGAGEGETILFFYIHGYRNFRCVELDQSAFRVLQQNVAKLTDASFDLRNKTFGPDDLAGVVFAKVDVEGGEVALLHLARVDLPSEIVVETHNAAIEEQFRQHLPEIRCLTTVWGKDCKLWNWVKPS
jgi:SAM-dependent methyltransferase